MNYFIQVIRNGIGAIISAIGALIGSVAGKTASDYVFLPVVIITLFGLIIGITAVFQSLMESIIQFVPSFEFRMIFFSLLPDNFSTCIAAWTTSNVTYMIFRFKYSAIEYFANK